MRWCALLLVIIIISPSANALLLPPGISPGSASFYSKTKIKSAANKLRYKSQDPSDYFFKGGLYALEFILPTILGGKLKSISVVKEFLGAGLKQAGMTSTGVSLSKRLMAPLIKNTPLKKVNDALSLNKHFAYFLVGLIRKRPTPGGLRLASKTAIEMAAESYYYTSSKTSPNNPHLLAAEAHLQTASNEYGSYTGFLDAFTLTYSKFSPEGYDKILNECLLAIDDLNLAKKEKSPATITAG